MTEGSAPHKGVAQNKFLQKTQTTESKSGGLGFLECGFIWDNRPRSWGVTAGPLEHLWEQVTAILVRQKIP